MTGDMDRFLIVGAVLFVLGAIGFLTRRNLILVVLSAEMMLHGVGITFVAFGQLHHTLEGQAFTIFGLTVAACEAGLALSLILALYRKTNSLDIELWSDLREPDLPSPISTDERISPEELPPVEHYPHLTPAGLPPQVDPDADLEAVPDAGVASSHPETRFREPILSKERTLVN